MSLALPRIDGAIGQEQIDTKAGLVSFSAVIDGAATEKFLFNTIQMPLPVVRFSWDIQHVVVFQVVT